VILMIPSAAYIARLTRTFMLEVLGQDYIRTARAKGLSESVVIFRHALRNIMVPLLTSMGIIFGGLISGTFVVETIFNIPGLGRMAIDSVFARDYPVAMAIVMLFTAFFVLINLAVDVAYALIDPRIRQRMVPA
jgi:ABC-type dipeptide/oligopeptide/nickel transport system permease component